MPINLSPVKRNVFVPTNFGLVIIPIFVVVGKKEMVMMWEKDRDSAPAAQRLGDSNKRWGNRDLCQNGTRMFLAYISIDRYLDVCYDELQIPH